MYGPSELRSPLGGQGSTRKLPVGYPSTETFRDSAGGPLAFSLSKNTSIALGEHFNPFIVAQVACGRYGPPRRIVFSYGWENGGRMGIMPETTKVEIELMEEKGKTRLNLLHTDPPDEHADFHDMGWGYFIGRLVALFADDALPEGRL